MMRIGAERAGVADGCAASEANDRNADGKFAEIERDCGQLNVLAAEVGVGGGVTHHFTSFLRVSRISGGTSWMEAFCESCSAWT